MNMANRILYFVDKVLALLDETVDPPWYAALFWTLVVLLSLGGSC